MVVDMLNEMNFFIKQFLSIREVGVCRWMYFRYLRLKVALTRPTVIYARSFIGGNGVPIRVGTSDIHAYYQVFLREDYGAVFVDSNLADSPMVDCGANVGYTALYVSYHLPGCRIFALEPDRSNFAALVKNTQACPNVFCFNLAIWSSDVILNLRHGTGEPGDEWARSFESREEPGLDSAIQGITLNNFLATHVKSDISLLKVDIEGAEVELLNADCAWIKQCRMAVFELHNEQAIMLFNSRFPIPQWEHRVSGELVIALRP